MSRGRCAKLGAGACHTARREGTGVEQPSGECHVASATAGHSKVVPVSPVLAGQMAANPGSVSTCGSPRPRPADPVGHDEARAVGQHLDRVREGCRDDGNSCRHCFDEHAGGHLLAES